MAQPPGVAEDKAMLRLLAIGVCLVGLVACANAPQTRNTAPPTAKNALRCPPNDTATRLPPRPGECSPGDVKSYTGEELEQTGATQVGDALRYLDPEITITHH